MLKKLLTVGVLFLGLSVVGCETGGSVDAPNSDSKAQQALGYKRSDVKAATQENKQPTATPVPFELSNADGSELNGVEYVLKDPEGGRESGDLSTDGVTDVDFE